MTPFQHTLNICINPGPLADRILSQPKGDVHTCYDDEIPAIRRHPPRSASGYYCVTKSGRYWSAHYTLYGKKINLYRGDDKAEAIRARIKWENENDFN